ncbi:amidohydrolase family protein [Salegentibacter sp. HM20]
MKIKYIYLLLISLCVGNLSAQQTPAPPQSEAVTIVGATAHLGNGEVIENSLIIFEDGKITQVLEATSKIEYRGRVIEAQGKHVYPGFIAPNSTLGLVEVDAVRASDDEEELGDLLPHVRSLIAYNAESRLVESMRPNGVLIAQVVPQGGIISGTSSIVQLDAWNWEDAVIKEDDGLHINWPRSFTRGRWWAGEDPGTKPSKEYRDNINKLTNFFAQSRAYLAGDRNYRHLPYQAMQGVFEGTKKVFVHVNSEKEILDVIEFKKEQELEGLVIVGGYEANKLVPQLKENNIAVLVQRPHSTPNNDWDNYDFPYALASELYKSGLLVAIEGSGRMERMNTRNLPFYAGTAVAYGLSKEEALQLITLNTAKILGIDETVGSLEKDKVATLFISSGDALDMRGNIIEKAFIQGREISLESHQSELYKRYMEKYERQSK